MFLKKKNYFLNLCLFMMMLGVFMGMNSESWIMMWLSMEITLMFFIPWLILDKSMTESFSCLKYFIFQCLGSIFFILGSLNIYIFYTFGLILKLGMFPNHFWALAVSKGLNWLNFFFFMTIQKFLPLMFIIFSLKFTLFYFLILIYLNSLVGNLGSLNQMDLRLLMSFSSMNHISWMIISSMLNMVFMYFYIAFYFMLMYFLYKFFNKMNMFYLFQVFYFKNINLKYSYLMIFILFFSFMGFPPFMGFFLKIISMLSLLNFFFFFFMLMVLMQNLLISFSYIRVVIFMFLNISRSMKVNKLNLKNYFNSLNMLIFLMLL